MEPAEIVGKKATETFKAIRELKKTMPQDRRWQKDELERKEKELKDKWWEEVKPLMQKGENDPPFRRKD